MLTARSVASIFLGTTIILAAGGVSGQAYPSKPIHLYTGTAGGNNDTTSRFVAGGISGPLGQQVIVEPRPPGAAPDIVAKAPPDGYSMMLVGDLFWISGLLRGQSDPFAGLAPVSMLGSSPNILVVHPSLPVKSVKELIALAKARPGELNYATGGVGAIEHIMGELFKSMTGTNIVHVTYKGATPTLTAVVSGETHLTILGVSVVSASVKAGRLRALAVTSAQSSVLAAGLPTLAASGLPGYDLVNTDQVYTTAKTPAAVINRLNQEIVRFLRTPAATERYLQRGSEVIATTPEEHAATLKSRVIVITKVIKDAGIKAN